MIDQISNNKSQTSTKQQKTNKYDLENRTLEFSRNVITLSKKLPKNTINFKLIDQLIRSATSIGANYREANEALGKKDFIYRLRISRKEAKETTYWLNLIMTANTQHTDETNKLIIECKELRNILSAIIQKAL